MIEHNFIIHKLVAENIYKVKYIELQLDNKGNLIKIGGGNGQGKTSLLEAIRIGFGGKAEAGTMPVRDGEKCGNIKIDCGEFIIERSITKTGMPTTITSKDGLRFASPQKMLDMIKSNLSFRPDKFMTMKPKERVETLKHLTGLDFSYLESDKTKAYDERTLINRELKKVNDNYEDKLYYYSALPQEETNIEEILNELKKAESSNEKHNTAAEHIKYYEREIAEYKSQIKSLEEKLKETCSLKKESEKILEEVIYITTDKYRHQIRVAEALNKKVEERKRYEQDQQRMHELQKQSDSLTQKIKDIDNEKSSQLAYTKFPIEGLGFKGDCVAYNDIPFDQLSHSERLKISVAMGMALNPNLKLILIEDASLFDDDNLKLIAEMAKEKGYQVLAEIVTRSKDEEKQCTIVIEDGEVKE